MKRKIFLLLLLAYSAIRIPQSAFGQEPDCFRVFTATGAGRPLIFENRLHGCTSWTLAYNSTGFTALNIQIERAADSSFAPGAWTVWTAASVVEGGPFPLTSTTGASAMARDFWPWVSVNITSVTGSGTISGALYGRRSALAASGPAIVGQAQPETLRNSRSVSAVNTAVTASVAAIAGRKVHLYAAYARCSAGTASLTVKDGVGGTTTFDSAATEVGTTTFRFEPPLSLGSTAGNGLDVVLGACGVSNTGTLTVIASQF